MSAREQLMLRLTADGPTSAATARQLLTEHHAEFEAYPGELAMLRGVLSVVRTIARHGDLGDTEGGRELRLLIAEHYADERAAYAEQGEKDTPTGESTPQPADSCRNCRQPFDQTDTRFDGHAQYGNTPFCRSCVDRCHESTDFAHECTVCRCAAGGDA